MKNLSIVATPIGNLADVTFRAVETLQNSDLIVSEDTRRAKILLDHYQIKPKKLISFHAQSSITQAEKIFTEFFEVENIAYISDAGTPGISDPGFRLLQAALKFHRKIIPIPGPSALTALISVAGVPVDKFIFYGFLPHKKGRQTLLKSFQDTENSVVFYESVHRFPRLLDELLEHVGSERMMVVGRELTKMHEEIFRGPIIKAKEFFTAENTKGEFVIIIAPTKFTFLR